MIGGFRQVIASEGAGAIWTGFGPTAAGYFLQGAFKFGGYELFKQQAINLVGYETASNNRTAVYLGAAGVAEFFADVALCPLEATRIRLVSEPTYANGLVGGFTKMLRTEGVGAFYAGFGPILLKQYVLFIPTTLRAEANLLKGPIHHGQVRCLREGRRGRMAKNRQIHRIQRTPDNCQLGIRFGRRFGCCRHLTTCRYHAFKDQQDQGSSRRGNHQPFDQDR